MNEKIAKFCYQLSFNSLVLVFLLTPVFFLPLTTDFFNFNKLILFFILTAISLLSWLVYNILSGIVRLTLSPLLLPLLLLVASVIVSTFFNHPNPEVWLTQTSLYIGILVYFLLTATLIQSSLQVKKILQYFITIGVTLALLGILSVLGAFTNLSLPAYLTAKNFSPAGSLLNLVSLLIIVLPLSLVFAFKSSLGPNKLKYFLASGILLSAIILTGYQVLPHKPYEAILLPQAASWSIAIDTLKTKFLFGAGPNNFLPQFNLFKPLNFNLTKYWAVNFTAAGNIYLQLLTTLGIFGLFSFIYLIIAWFKLIKRDPGTRITGTQLAVNCSLIATLILGLFIPFSNSIWIIFGGLLSLSVGLNKSKNLTKVKDILLSLNAVSLVEPYQPAPPVKPLSPSGLLPWFLALPVALGLIIFVFNLSKSYLGEYYFQQSLIAAEKNLGSETYNLQIKAIELAPTVDRYRVSYSNINLALANSLAAQSNLTDQDKQTVTTLIQQSIREARVATQLDPSRSGNWQNLANLYRQLINFANGADNFSSAAYIQAIQLDPSNPQLRLDLGGLMYSLERYDEAVDRFKEAVQLKPDMPNAYYNLSAGYQKQNKLLEAYQAMQQVAALIPSDSVDAPRIQTELNDLKAKLPKTSLPNQNLNATGSATLNQPSPLPAAPSNLPEIQL